jgi:AcrR family transcriptional regulator
MSDLRHRISGAAQELYLEDGIEGFSMRKVADRVGVSATAIYRHFENKEELLNEIRIEGLKVLERYLEPVLAEGPPIERLIALTERYLSFAVEQPKYFDFAFLVPDPDIQRFADEVARPAWDTFRVSIDQIQACVDEGIFAPEDPLETAIVLWAEAHGLVTLFRTGRFGPDPEAFRAIYGRCIERLLNGLRK